MIQDWPLGRLQSRDKGHGYSSTVCPAEWRKIRVVPTHRQMICFLVWPGRMWQLCRQGLMPRRWHGMHFLSLSGDCFLIFLIALWRAACYALKASCHGTMRYNGRNTLVWWLMDDGPKSEITQIGLPKLPILVTLGIRPQNYQNYQRNW